MKNNIPNFTNTTDLIEEDPSNEYDEVVDYAVEPLYDEDYL